MNHRRIHIALFAGLALGGLAIGSFPASAQPRIGVFDSRAVALAYGRSAEFMQMIGDMRADQAKAKAANDQKRVDELEQQGQWMQVRMHQLVFSTGPVSSILEKVKDKIPAVAQQAGVAVIVSKWEMPFKDPGVETVDVTLALVRLFKPGEQTLKFVEEMKSQEPIPFEQLPLDPKM